MFILKLIACITFAAAGDMRQARKLRELLIGPSGDAGRRSCLECLPEPVRRFSNWVLDTANADLVDLVEVRDWHRSLLAATGTATTRWAG